jgi:hypothetical protein
MLAAEWASFPDMFAFARRYDCRRRRSSNRRNRAVWRTVIDRARTRVLVFLNILERYTQAMISNRYERHGREGGGGSGYNDATRLSGSVAHYNGPVDRSANEAGTSRRSP